MQCLLMKLLLIGLFISTTNAKSKRDIRIGAIFSERYTTSEIAFRSAIKRANIYIKDFELVPVIKYASEVDSYKTEMEACDLIQEGVAAIFGPPSNIASGIVDSICNTFHVPHIMTHWTYEPIGFHHRRREQPRNLSINVYPDSDILSRAMADLIQDYDWKSYTIVYDTDENLIRLKDVLGLHGPREQQTIRVVQLNPGNDSRPILKKINKLQETHIILSINSQKTLDIFRQAKQLNMLDEYKNYIITSLDAHTIDLTRDIENIRSNITSLRLLDPNNDEIDNAANFMRDEEKKLGLFSFLTKEEYVRHMQTESVLYYDAVQLFSRAFDELNSVEEIWPMSMRCSDPREWQDGLKVASYMKAREIEGITGPFAFNAHGQRTNFLMEIVELQKKNYYKRKEQGTSHMNAYKKIGTWDAYNQIIYTRPATELKEQIDENMQSKVFKVVTRLGAPFLTKKNPKKGETLEGNNQYEGYSLDLIDGIAKMLNFTYEIIIEPEGKYGRYDKTTKQWDGLVRYLLDRRADLAICDLTITQERRAAVDFTTPFMNLGISILMLKPTKKLPGLFSFLEPLSTDVWICTAAAYVGVSILICCLARLAHAEWEDPHPCRPVEEKQNIWGMLNSIWLVMGSVMGQGSDLLPKAISTRLVTGMWYFFALIMLASYTANLAAFLTMERMDSTIENAEDLAKQTKIKYGVLYGGSTYSFFRDSNHSTYKRMFAAMESTTPSVFTNSNDEGRDRVLNGKGFYAYLMESTSLEYITERNCTLTQVGELLDSKGYGIAMPRDSPYRKLITGAILELGEKGKLHQYKTRWWKEEGGGGACRSETTAKSGSAAELGVANVGGVFLLVALGIVAGFIIAISEFLWNVRKVAVEEKTSQWEALKNELAFAVKVNISTKPIKKTTSEISSSNQSKRSGSLSA